jgi:putative ABC transport system permease protein
MTAFALAALALAVTGIYAVVAYSVGQRTREIAIRIALGASRSSIVGVVMRHGIGPAAAGLVCGAAAAFVAMRLLSTMVFGLAANDAATFAEAVIAVAAASLAACAVPAARAGRAIVASALTGE